MTIRDLIKAIQGLNPDMEIFIDDGNMLSPICDDYLVLKVAIGETIEESEILLLRPCASDVDEESKDLLIDLNLN